MGKVKFMDISYPIIVGWATAYIPDSWVVLGIFYAVMALLAFGFLYPEMKTDEDSSGLVYVALAVFLWWLIIPLGLGVSSDRKKDLDEARDTIEKLEAQLKKRKRKP